MKYQEISCLNCYYLDMRNVQGVASVQLLRSLCPSPVSKDQHRCDRVLGFW